MKLIVCSSVLAETFNYSNDPCMWHRYVLKLLLWVSTFFVEYLQNYYYPWCTSFLTGLFHIYINGYFDIWNFIWYGRYFMHICGGLPLCCWSLHKALSVTATLRPQESLYSNIAEASYYIMNDWKINCHMMTTALYC